MSRLADWLATSGLATRWWPARTAVVYPWRLRLALAQLHEILDAEARLAELEALLGAETPAREVGRAEVADQAREALELAHRIVHDTCALAGLEQVALYERVDRARRRLDEELAGRPMAASERLTLELAACGEEVWGLCGGPAAQLGTLGARLHLPVADGFVITTFAARRLLEANALGPELDRLATVLVSGEGQAGAVTALRKLLLGSTVPADVRRAVERAVARVATPDLPRRFAMYLSPTATTGRDPVALAQAWVEVPPGEVVEAYLELLAAAVNLEAAGAAGATPAELEAVVCVAIPAGELRGVVATAGAEVDPAGLVVEWAPEAGPGDRRGAGSRRAAVALARTPPHLPCAGDEARAAALPAGVLEQLGVAAVAAERFARRPQQLDWALDATGAPRFLAIRAVAAPAAEALAAAPPPPSAPVILRHLGVVASRGIAAGPVVRVSAQEPVDPERVPPGAVLCADVASPGLSVAMDRVAAIICEVGAPTGHLAALAREFRVPTIVDVGATGSVLPAGLEVTVDADANLVYAGRVAELLEPRCVDLAVLETGRLRRGVLRVLQRFGGGGESLSDLVGVAHAAALAALRRRLGTEAAAVRARPLDTEAALALTVAELDPRPAQTRVDETVRRSELRSAPLGVFLAAYLDVAPRAGSAPTGGATTGTAAVAGDVVDLLLERDGDLALVRAALAGEPAQSLFDVCLEGRWVTPAAAAALVAGTRDVCRRGGALECHRRRQPREAVIEVLARLGRALGAASGGAAGEGAP